MTLKELIELERIYKRVGQIDRALISTKWCTGSYDGPAQGIVEYNGKLHAAISMSDIVFKRWKNPRRFHLIDIPVEVMKVEVEIHRLQNEMIGHYCDFKPNGERISPNGWRDESRYQEWIAAVRPMEVPYPKEQRWGDGEVIGWFEGWRLRQ